MKFPEKLLLLCLSFFSLTAHSQWLDPTFADNGSKIIAFGDGKEMVTAMLVRENGRILCAGYDEDLDDFSTEGIVFQLMPNGDLDESFGENGVIRIAETEVFLKILDLLIDGSGNIVISGTWDGIFMVARLLPDGSFDGSFGEGGKVLLEPDLLFPGAYATTICLQPDGAIIAGGWFLADTEPTARFIIARLLDNGELDTSFSDDGYFEFQDGHQNYIFQVEVDEEGRIVYLGYLYLMVDDVLQFRSLLGRLKPNGEPDDDFANSDGYFLFSEDEYACNFIWMEDGGIVTSGYGRPQGFPTVMIRKITEQGVDDISFGEGTGRAYFETTPDAHSVAYSICRLADGGIMAGSIHFESDNVQYMLNRFSTDGQLDLSFGNEGKMLGGEDIYGEPGDIQIAQQADGAVLMSGGKKYVESDGLVVRFHTGLAGEIEENESFIQSWPNPANDVIYISARQSISRLDIIDATGRIALSFEKPGQNMPLDISDLSSGSYFLSVHFNNGERETRKFLKMEM